MTPNLLIESKLHAPLLKHRSLERSSLLSSLDAVMTRKLALVHAPAGYGKTTLLCQFYHRQSANGVAVAWLTLDEDDQSPDRFLAYLVGALRRSGSILKGFRHRVEHRLTNVQQRAIVESLVGKLSSSAVETILIFDDYDKAESTEIDELVGLLIRALPANVHLIITCRQNPLLHLATLRVQDELVRIDVRNLRFSAKETKSLLGKKALRSLSDEDVRLLIEKTEGWPIALQLVRMWQRESGSGPARVKALSGRVSEIADYLFEQVFSRFTTVEQEFALNTSVLDRLNGDIANAICHRSDCWKILEHLERENLFIMALDKERRWYRYHALFRDFLHQRLMRESTARVLACHLKAGEWFARDGQVDEAIRHYLQAEKPELAAQIADRIGGWRLALRGGTAILSKVCSSVPASVIEKHLRLRLGRIFITAKNGDLTQAQNDLNQLKRSEKDVLDADETLLAEIKVLDTLLAGYVDRPLSAGEVADLEASVVNGSSLDVTMLAMLHNYLCLVYLDNCEFDKSKLAAEQSIAHYQAAGYHYAVDVVKVSIAQGMVVQGRLSDTAELCEQMICRTDQQLIETDAIYSVVAAEIAYERNELRLTSELLDRAFPYLDEYGTWFNIYASLYKTAASLARVQRGCDAALEVLDQARTTAARRRIERLERLVDILVIRELILAGRMTEATTFAKTRNALARDNRKNEPARLIWQTWEQAEAVQARFEIERGNLPKAVLMLNLLVEYHERHGCRRQLIATLILLSLADAKQEGTLQALQTLDRALSLAVEERFIRVFVDEGHPMRVLLETATHHMERLSKRNLEFVQSILDCFEPRGRREQSAESAFETGKLTKRESDVLELIGTGLSSKEIATKLNLSENTVKHHRKSIYRKLRVSSRSKAVAEARRLHLA